MSRTSVLSRGLCAVAIIVASAGGSVSVAGASGAEQPTLPAPQALTLPAPFACGTEWEGTTYGGHGKNNWNLDINRADGSSRDDLGQEILAQADGTVVWLKTGGYNNGAGTYIEIDYGEITARYIHLVDGSIPAELTEIGTKVEAGELIGLLGDTGHTTAPHLHLEYWDSADFDDTAWYQLPRENQIPVAFAGQAMIATPSTATAVAVSTNCDEERSDKDEKKRLERDARRREQRQEVTPVALGWIG